MKSQRKTYITLEVTHTDILPHLVDMVAGRAYNIQGVIDVRVIDGESAEALKIAGFSPAEIALGHGEVHRT